MLDKYGPVTNSAKDLAPIVPYIYNIHGKFYEMTEDLKRGTITPFTLESGMRLARSG